MKPYTDADVELAARAIYLNDWPDATANGWPESAMSDEYRQNARAALDALAAAGRLRDDSEGSVEGRAEDRQDPGEQAQRDEVDP